jgi:hypothetical protein
MLYSEDNQFSENDVIYSLCVGDLQEEAKSHLKRELTTDEIICVKDLLSDGLGENLGGIFSAIFSELPQRL